MKISSSLFILATALAFTACSDNDDSGAPKDTAKINFSVSVPKSPRAVTTTSSINQFKTWGYVNQKVYMEDVEVNRVDNGSWSYQPAQYWPADEQKVNFYSYSPADLSTETPNTPDNPDIPGFINNGTTDLLYGVNIGESSKSSVVKINFRHALAQVKFLFKRITPPDSPQPIDVKVRNVTVTGTYSTASFHFPTETTAAENPIVGEWVEPTDIKDMAIFDGEKSLTDEAVELNSTGNMFAIPQDLTESTDVTKTDNGAYVKVLCDIYDQKTGTKLWPSQSDETYDPATGAGYLYFPLNNNSVIEQWDAGRSYRYVLTIGVPKDSSGYIDFDITVDDYEEFD